MLTLSIGRILVEVNRPGDVGLAVGRQDSHTGEQIRVHTGNANPGTGHCGRFTVSGRLVYYCRMTTRDVEKVRTLFAANGASNFVDLRTEDRLSGDLLSQTVSAVRSPTFEELGLAVDDLLQEKPYEWGGHALLTPDGTMHSFYVTHAFEFYNEADRSVEQGIDCWNLIRLGDPSEPWRVEFPDWWSSARCEIRYEAEEELAAYVAVLTARLRGTHVPPRRHEWETADEVQHLAARAGSRYRSRTRVPK